MASTSSRKWRFWLNKEVQEKLIQELVMEVLLELQEIGMVAAPEKSGPLLRQFAFRVLLMQAVLGDAQSP